MLTVRREQLHVIGNERRQRFEARLIAHAQACFPEVARELGNRLGAAVEECARQARAYGLSTEREICKYLNLAFTFGRNFDRDPRCPWAGEILRGGLPGRLKIERLYEAGAAHEHEARGFFALIGFQDA